MKNFLIIYPQIDSPMSGGQVYDFKFFKQLEILNKNHTTYLLDKDIGGKSLFDFIIKYILKLPYIMKFDIIVTNGRLYPRLTFCFLFLFFLKKEIILLHHHFNFMVQKKSFKRILHKLTEIFFIRHSTFVVAASRYTKENVNKYCPLVKIRHIDTAFTVKKKFSVLNKKRARLLYVGSIIERKGIIHLLELAFHLKKKNYDFHITIAGEITDNVYYEKLTKKMMIYGLYSDVTFTGRISQKYLEELYEESSIFVFPSYHEGFGRVLVEAMAFSLPVVAFNNSAIPYTVINGVNGLLADNKNGKEFNKKVEMLLSDENLLEKLRKNAFDTYQNCHSENDFNREVSEFINELIMDDK
jgi:glycosyltransferase involved in cell wall biosynthesis